MPTAFSLKVTIAIGIGLSMLIVLSVIAFRTVDESYVAGLEVRRMLAVDERLESIRLDLFRAETAQLKYQLTGIGKDLEELQAISTHIRAAIKDLDMVLVAPDQKDRLNALERAVSARLEAIADASRPRTNGRPAVAQAGAAPANGIAGISDAMTSRERHMMKTAGERAEDNALFASRVTFWTAALAAVLLVWVILVIHRYEKDRRRSDRELRGARERLAVALEGSTSAVWDWDMLSDDIYLSEGWPAMLGAKAAESTVKSAELIGLVHPDDVTEVRKSIQDALTGTRPEYLVEHRVRQAHGSWIWILSRGKVVLRNASGRALRMAGINQNVTEKKRIELALKEHDERLMLALETAAMVSWDWDVATDRFVWHESPERLLGPGGSSGSTHLQDMVHPEDLARFIRTLEQAARTGEEYKDTFRITRTDGRIVWVQARGRPERDPGGKTVRIIGVAQDISEIKQAEQALRASERELRLITDSVPALISRVDRDERIVFGNSALGALLGIRPADLIGRSLHELFGPETYRVIEPYSKRALAGENVRFQRTHQARNGAVLDLDVTFVPKRSALGELEGFYSLSTDITELKQVDRLKSEFVSTVSHELRTPLTSIRGSLGLLAGGVAGALPDKAKSFIDIAKNNCERLVRLINDLLDMEKLESGRLGFQMRVLDLMELVGQVVGANEGFALQNDVRLQVAAAAPGLRVNADSDRLAQVLTNLISNACKFSPAGSTVDISVSAEGNEVRVAVVDHGPGIPEEFQGRIFQKFSQADSSDVRQKSGSGLGLSISKAIIEGLGGRIGFDTRPEERTTFYFLLPQWREPPAAEASSITGRPRLLVCEDDPDVARLLQAIVDKAGYDSDLAASAAQAKTLLAERRYAAMTLDLRLPDEDGLSLVRQLRARADLPAIPVIVVSAVAQEGKLQVAGEALGIVDWLSKPIDEKRLLAALCASDGTDRRIRVLHVEDDADVRRVVASLARNIADFSAAESLAQARVRLGHEAYDLLLLDLGLPDGSGWELLPVVNQLNPRPSVVIFSAQDSSVASEELACSFLVKSQTSDQQLIDTIRDAVKGIANLAT